MCCLYVLVSIKINGHEYRKLVSDSASTYSFLLSYTMWREESYLTQSQFSHNPLASFTVDHLSSDSSHYLPSHWSTFSPPLLPSVTVTKPTFDSGTVLLVCVTSFSYPECCRLVTFCLPDVFWVQVVRLSQKNVLFIWSLVLIWGGQKKQFAIQQRFRTNVSALIWLAHAVTRIQSRYACLRPAQNMRCCFQRVPSRSLRHVYTVNYQLHNLFYRGTVDTVLLHK